MRPICLARKMFLSLDNHFKESYYICDAFVIDPELGSCKAAELSSLSVTSAVVTKAGTFRAFSNVFPSPLSLAPL